MEYFSLAQDLWDLAEVSDQEVISSTKYDSLSLGADQTPNYGILIGSRVPRIYPTRESIQLI